MCHGTAGRWLVGLAVLVVVGSGSSLQGARTVCDDERGLLFLYAWQDNYNDIGACVEGTTPNMTSSKGRWSGLTNPDALRISHGRFTFYMPNDDSTWVYFPYTRFKNYEADELAHGRGKLWVTATYQGSSRPVYWDWSLGFTANGGSPSTSSSGWKQAVAIADDRFVKFWIHEYIYGISGKNNCINVWNGGDECAFQYALYGIVDNSNIYHSGVTWDLPFPQNNTEFVNSVSTMFSRMHALAPDIRTMPNFGAIGNYSLFNTAFGNADSLMLEDIFNGNIETPSNYDRDSFYNKVVSFQWFSSQGKSALLRSHLDNSTPANYDRSLRVHYTGYLLDRGDNFFWSPTYTPGWGGSNPTYTNREVNPADYAAMKNGLGRPVAPTVFSAQLGASTGYRLFSRQCEGGWVYLNYSGSSQTVTLPAGAWYKRGAGSPVTTLTIPDMDADWVTSDTRTRAAIPTVIPIRPGTVCGSLAVTLKTSTSGEVHYTTDGTSPTLASPRYTAPFAIASNCTVNAATLDPTHAMADSFVKSVQYTLTGTPPTVQFYFAGDNNSEFVRYHYPLVSLSCASASTVTVQYRVTGGTATLGSDFTSPGGNPGTITFQPGETYKRFELDITNDNISGPDETIVLSLSSPTNATLGSQTSYTYTIMDNDMARVADPVLTPAPGAYASAQSVSITCSTPGAVIHYTTDGTTPSASSPVYSTPIAVNGTLTIYAVAYADGLAASAVVGGSYAILATPVLSPANAVFLGSGSVTISCGTPGAVLRYTTNGTAPTTGSPVYSGPITVANADGVVEKITALAWSGSVASASVVGSYVNWSALDRPGAIYPGKATIDGDLSEWDNTSFVPLDKAYSGTPTDTISASCAVKWDPATSRIYVAVKVSDSGHYQTSTITGSQHDVVELYIHAPASLGRTDYYYDNQTEAQQYVVGVRTDNASVWVAMGPTAAAPPALPATITAAAKSDGLWYSYEAAITPYDSYGGLSGESSVPSVLHAGDLLGFDAVAVSGAPGTNSGYISENLKKNKYIYWYQEGLHRLQIPYFTAGDLAALLAAMDATSADPGYLARYDFDGDYQITSDDLAYMLVNMP